MQPKTHPFIQIPNENRFQTQLPPSRFGRSSPHHNITADGLGEHNSEDDWSIDNSSTLLNMKAGVASIGSFSLANSPFMPLPISRLIPSKESEGMHHTSYPHGNTGVFSSLSNNPFGESPTNTFGWWHDRPLGVNSKPPLPISSDCKTIEPVIRPNTHSVSEKDESVEEEVGCKKINKGLKLLSIVVRDIVIDKKSTTYKEVAELILKESMQEGQLNPNQKSELAKEEQNIKRRVYDALNVLIAAGVLLKNGKRVMENDLQSQQTVNGKRCQLNSMVSKVVS